MPTSPLQPYHPRWGWLCMFLGLYPIGFALKFFPTGDTTGYAPMWLMFLFGLAFVMAGTVILVKRHSPINTLLVTLILLMLGAMGIGVSLFSPAEEFVGSFRALSEDQNVVLARWMFGLGAVLAFMTSGYCIQQLLLSTIHPQAFQTRPGNGNGNGNGPSSSSSRNVNARNVSGRNPRTRSVSAGNTSGRNPSPRSSSDRKARLRGPNARNVSVRSARRHPRPNFLRQLLVPRSPVPTRRMQRSGEPTPTNQRFHKSHKRVRPQVNRAPVPPRQR